MKRIACSVVSCIVLACASIGQASEVRINPQDLRSALIELSSETGLTIVAADDLIAGRRSAGTNGSSHAKDALTSILQGTGLSAEFQNNTAVIVSQGNEDPFDLGRITLGGVSAGGTGAFNPFEEERSIQTLDAEELEKQNITDLGDALERTPNVFVTGRREPIALQLSVRGISNLGGGFSGPTVGLFVDGVLLNSVVAFGNANPPLFDVESVDVFLGPQTTTFSRITTAGAVNVVTKKPTDQLEFSLEGDIGRFDTGSDFSGSTTFVGNVPLLKDGRLSARLVVFETRNDGYISTRGRDLVGRPTDKISDKSSSVRLSLRARPRDDLTLDFQFTYTEVEYDSIWGSLTNINLLELGQYVAFVDPAGPERADDYLARFEVAYDTGIGTFKSMTSFRGSYTASDTDGDVIPTVDLTNAGFNRNIDTLSQEFTYTGLPLEFGALPGEVTVNAGLSVSYTETFGAQIITFGSAISGLVPGITPEQFGGSYGYSRQRALNTGVYGDVAWRPTPPLELSGGLRFAYDRFKFTRESAGVGLANVLGLAEVAPFVSIETAFTALSPRLAVSYDWSDTLTTYAAYSEGQRPGGVSLFSAPEGLAVNFYDKEITRSVELGVRSLFYDGLLQVNATAFYTEIEDFQLPVEVIFPGTLIPPRSLVDNAGDGTSYGAELNVSAVPITGLTLQANAGVNFTEISNFRATLFGTDPNNPPNLEGIDFPNAPEFTLALSGEYEHPRPVWGKLRGYIRADLRMSSSFLGGTISANPTRLDGFETVDLRLGLRSDRFFVEVFGENIFNERYATTSNSTNPLTTGVFPFSVTGLPQVALGPVGVPGPPRRIGIRGKIEF